MEYYRLIKPGIVYGNAMTALAAFVFASGRVIATPLLLGMLVGIMAVIAASCVINNVLDKDIDARMERTKKRALPSGRISVRNALWFAAVLMGFGILSFVTLTNVLTLVVALFGVVVYLCFYTPTKRTTPYSTIIGALAGAVPPVVGYTAVTNTLDATALTLFLILVSWQMVHFFAISIFRRDDYQNAGLPVMSVHLGIPRTKVLMSAYTFIFALAAYALFVLRTLGSSYAWIMGLVSLGWILLSFSQNKDDATWARTMFFYSIAVLLVFCVTLALS